MKTYMVYGIRKEYFYQRVKANNKQQAEEIANSNEWEPSDYYNEQIYTYKVEVD